MLAGVVFERIGEEELPLSRQLFKKTFGMELSLRHWRRKYYENPAGKTLGFGAFYKERLISFMAYFPAVFKLEGQEVIVYQSADVMTDPEYQRQGLHRRIKHFADDHLRELGIPLGFGFPNANTRAARSKDEYIKVGKMTLWTKAIASSAGGIKHRMAYWTSNLISLFKPRVTIKEVERLKSFDTRIDLIWNRLGGEGYIVGRRDKDFLDWHFVERRGFHSWLVNPCDAEGYIVVELTSKGVWIRDLVVSVQNKSGFYCLIIEVIKFAATNGSQHIIFPYLGTCFNSLLWGAGFIPLPGQSHFAVYELAGSNPAWAKRENWFITDADRDWQ